jgi:hypothetical protein
VDPEQRKEKSMAPGKKRLVNGFRAEAERSASFFSD